MQHCVNMASSVYVCVVLLSVLCAQTAGFVCTKNPDKDVCTDQYDVVVVGAGPSGAYSAYKLRDSGMSVGLFEYSNRVGGRAYTYKDMPGAAKVEQGAMRYIDGCHRTLQGLVGELGLTQTVFTEGYGRAGRTRYFLEGQSFTKTEVSDVNVQLPYNLTAAEKANQGRILEYYLEELTGHSLQDNPTQPGQHPYPLTRSQLLNLKVLRHDRHLYKYSWDEAMDLVASPDGKRFAAEKHSFKTDQLEGTSVVNTYDDEFGEDAWCDNIYRVLEGKQTVHETMVQRFQDAASTNKFWPNSQLTAIRERSKVPTSPTDYRYVLYFDPTITVQAATFINNIGTKKVVCAKQVILGMPVYALNQIDWDGLRSPIATQAYNAVRPIPASKIHMTFPRPWWRDNADRQAFVTKGDLTFSQFYDMTADYTSNSSVYLAMVSYADASDAETLKSLNQRGQVVEGSEPGAHKVTQPLKDRLLDELSQVYGVPRSSIPEPTSSMAQWWSGFPFGGGWITWQKGYHYGDVQAVMRRPSIKDDVYVVGSDYAWGMLTGWQEGALRTAASVLRDYFGVE